MKICGIVAEFNPFHNGHAHLLRETRTLLGEETGIVCCMSGNFVQRGQGALLPKHLRAKAALQSGADLVLELPAPYALRSAEGFASSAVSILAALGQVTDLSFGAEDADTDALMELSGLLLEHKTVQDTLMHLRTGISYAAARERALYQQVQEQAELLRKPNNILAIEYCKALQAQKLDITAHAIPRAGVDHDAAETAGDFASASLLRQMLTEGNVDALAPYLPVSSAQIIREAAENGLLLTDTAGLDAAALPHLLRLTMDDLAALPDATEGLEHRLYAAIRQSRSLQGMAEAAQTKRYPLARVRRMLMCAYLGITAEESAAAPTYIRVLGFSRRGQEILRRAAKTASLPIITKPAHARDLGGAVGEAFAREVLRCDLYHLALPSHKNIPLGNDWRTNPVMLRREEK
jgi:predicted nucleotidyltransferase